MYDYPKIPDLNKFSNLLKNWTKLKAEYGAEGLEDILNNVEEAMQSGLEEIKNKAAAEATKAKRPNQLAEIKKLRPAGPRKIWKKLNRDTYNEKLAGGLLGRFAGCTLGAPVEFWSIDKMERLARENEMGFPPQDYWKYVPDPYQKRYQMSKRESYTRDKLDGVPVDDDTVYTLLGLLIAEDHGLDFTVADVGEAWLKYLPYACTAEEIALANLKKGISPEKAGEKDNPFCEWIGADIRSDPWGYLAAGWPEKAAEMAYYDAYISHRREGIYGEMFFSAVIAASFAVDGDYLEAIQIGLSEIPRECELARAIKWALGIAPEIKTYQEAREIVDEKFSTMDGVHTINNACLTIFGLTIGDNDFTRVIGETVAMGLDNDCTAATAGSISGVLLGKKEIPEYWYENFNNIVHSYLIEQEEFQIDDLLDRFYTLTDKLYK